MCHSTLAKEYVQFESFQFLGFEEYFGGFWAVQPWPKSTVLYPAVALADDYS
jgi:hypothetical protein